MSRLSRRLCATLSATIVTALAATSAHAGSVWDTFGGAAGIQLQYNDGTNQQVYQTYIPTVTKIPNGINFTGNSPDSAGGNTRLFSITGAQYAALNAVTTGDNRGLFLIGLAIATLNPNYDPSVDRFETIFNFGVVITPDPDTSAATGGTVNLFNVSDHYALNQGDPFGSSSTLISVVGSSGFTNTYTAGTSYDHVRYLDAFGDPNAPQGDHIIADYEMNFEWTGYSLGDTLEFVLPSPGFQLQQIAIPEPSSLALLTLPLTALTRRRRA
jgi:hypothetical protein